MKRLQWIFLLILASIGVLNAQPCIDMQTLTDGVEFYDREVHYLFTTYNPLTGVPTHTYGWKNIDVPADHPNQKLITENGFDELCPMLRKLPPRKNTAVLLFTEKYEQPTDSAQGHGITFTYNVTAEKPMLALQYAAVIEVSDNHPIAEQYSNYGSAWCKMRVIVRKEDVNDTIKNVTFNPYLKNTVADFQSFTDTRGRKAVWKDWTSDTLDMYDYIGEEVLILLESYDCALVKSVSLGENSNTFEFCEAHEAARLYSHVQCFSYTCEGTFTCPAALCADATTLCLQNEFTPGSVTSYDLVFDDKMHDVGFVDQVNATLEKDDADICLSLIDNATAQPLLAPDNYTMTLTLHTLCREDVVIPMSFTLMPDFKGTFTCPESVCANTTMLQIEAKYTKGSIETYSLLFDDNAHAVGLQDIVDERLDDEDVSIDIPLPFNPADSLHYPRPGNYTATLSIHTVCNRDTIIPIAFSILYPSWLVSQRWNDILYLLNENYNGGYTFSDIQWYKDGTLVEGGGEHNAYYYSAEHFDYAANHTYHVSLTRSDDGQTQCSCPFTPKPQDEADEPQLVQTQVNADGSIRLKISKKVRCEYTVYNAAGMVVQNGFCSPEEAVNIHCPTAALHIIRLHFDDGTSHTMSIF